MKSGRVLFRSSTTNNLKENGTILLIVFISACNKKYNQKYKQQE